MTPASISAGCRPEIVIFVIVYTCPSQSQATIRENSELISVCVLVFTLMFHFLNCLLKLKLLKQVLGFFSPNFNLLRIGQWKSMVQISSSNRSGFKSIEMISASGVYFFFLGNMGIFFFLYFVGFLRRYT